MLVMCYSSKLLVKGWSAFGDNVLVKSRLLWNIGQVLPKTLLFPGHLLDKGFFSKIATNI